MVLFAMLVCSLGACDQDPLGRSKRLVSSPFALHQFEDLQTYYLVTDSVSDGGGVLEGTVLSLGWSDRIILAKRKAMFGGREDWMIVDVTQRRVLGPFDSVTAAGRSEVAGIEMMSADSAWRRLR